MAAHPTGLQHLQILLFEPDFPACTYTFSRIITSYRHQQVHHHFYEGHTYAGVRTLVNTHDAL